MYLVTMKRCKMVHSITNYLRYVRNDDNDYETYYGEYDGPPELGDIYYRMSIRHV